MMQLALKSNSYAVVDCDYKRMKARSISSCVPRSLSLLLWVLGLTVASPVASVAQGPVVFWASSPGRPGETVLFYGDGLEKVDDIRLLRLADEPGGPPALSPLPQPRTQGLPAKPLQPSRVSV